MRNTIKLKYILQLYNVTIEMDEEENIHFTITDKRNGERNTIIDKSYTVVVRRGFVFMNKHLKKQL